MPSKIEKTCPVCKKKFITSNRKQIRCSWACMGKAYSTSIKAICQCCGKEFMVQPHRIESGRGKYCSKECSNKGRIAIIKKQHGYILEYCPEHPDAVNMYVRQHRLVMEKSIGRKLFKEEVVHHINRDRSDNRLENLMLLANKSEHRKIHLADSREIGKRVYNEFLTHRKDGKFKRK